MTSVQSHQRQLSGSRVLIVLMVLVFLSSCSIFRPTAPPVKTEPKEEPIEPEEPKEVEKEETPVEPTVNSVVLLLPFQLNRIAGEPSREDVKRVSVPLDFYQGFKLAMDNLTQRGNNFKLTVLDSRDNAVENRRMAVSPEVQSADLIVGPIFPQEIEVFSSSSKAGHALQVSPLAASKPSQFMHPNLVSLIAPIDLHSFGIADYIEKIHRRDDQVILINKADEESVEFLTPLKRSFGEKGIQFTEVNDVNKVRDILNLVGNNIIVVGSTNKYAVNSILTGLVDLKDELDVKIDLFGHPNWSRGSFDTFNLELLNTKISTSFYVNADKSTVRDFQRKYRDEFKIEPTEYAYKGFDTGFFFGYMLAKYGKDYPQHLTEETYAGVQTDYRFERNSAWGYVNTFVRILEFNGYKYVPVN
ncbi:type 1 periplasmic-binding domain-containing protein [Albibacterium indicum]|uniref:hypothetical protein n=1 Tax=Albibacterium indicum TaxID=2292082 RepID=UPI0013006227|nr:hypothetical protein [Pedobacter indicus]